LRCLTDCCRSEAVTVTTGSNERFNANNVNSDIFFDTVKRKSLTIVGGVVLAVLIICAAVWIGPFALVRSGTEVVGDVLSPDGKWDVVLMVRNGGATTDFSTQLSVIPAVGRLSREIALGRPGNVFIADGNHGAVAVNDRGFMHVDVVWQSPNLVLVTFPPSARVFKQERRFHSIIVKYEN
jgi:hypothetical protein